MSDPSAPHPHPLRGAVGAPVVADTDAFAGLVAGWQELDATGDLCGALLLVRVGLRVRADDVIDVVHDLLDAPDVLAALDRHAVGVLADLDPSDIGGLAARVHGGLRRRFAAPVWVAAVAAGAAHTSWLELGHQALAQGFARPDGCIVQADGSITEA